MTSELKKRQNAINAQKSTGPRTDRGKRRSSVNARKHGIHVQRTRLIREESLEFEERFRKWSTSGNLDPESDVQEFLVFQLVGDSFEIERVRELRLERRKERIEKAEENELADVEETGEMLFFDPCGPAAISGTRTHDWRKVRTSWTGKNPDPDRPAALVTKLESSQMGLFWLLDRWTELHERLEGGGFWSRGDRLRACRLMGRQMLDALDDRCVADVLACSYVLRPIGKQFSEFESDMDEFTKDAYVKDLRARYKDLVGKDEPERARQTLIELVDEHLALIGEMLDEYEQQDPEERARRTIKMLALDLSPVGDNIRGYEAKLKNAFNRGFEAYQKYKATKKKREGGEWNGGGGGGGIPAEGRSGVTLRARGGAAEKMRWLMMPMWRRAGGGCRRGAWRRNGGNLKYQVLKLKSRGAVRGNRWRAHSPRRVPPSSRAPAPRGRRKTLKTKPNSMSMCRLRKFKRISMLWRNLALIWDLTTGLRSQSRKGTAAA